MIVLDASVHDQSMDANDYHDIDVASFQMILKLSEIRLDINGTHPASIIDLQLTLSDLSDAEARLHYPGNTARRWA